jgi:hypothetical protein
VPACVLAVHAYVLALSLKKIKTFLKIREFDGQERINERRRELVSVGRQISRIVPKTASASGSNLWARLPTVRHSSLGNVGELQIPASTSTLSKLPL